MITMKQLAIVRSYELKYINEYKQDIIIKLQFKYDVSIIYE